GRILAVKPRGNRLRFGAEKFHEKQALRSQLRADLRISGSRRKQAERVASRLFLGDSRNEDMTQHVAERLGARVQFRQERVQPVQSHKCSKLALVQLDLEVPSPPCQQLGAGEGLGLARPKLWCT